MKKVRCAVANLVTAVLVSSSFLAPVSSAYALEFPRSLIMKPRPLAPLHFRISFPRILRRPPKPTLVRILRRPPKQALVIRMSNRPLNRLNLPIPLVSMPLSNTCTFRNPLFLWVLCKRRRSQLHLILMF